MRDVWDHSEGLLSPSSLSIPISVILYVFNHNQIEGP